VMLCGLCLIHGFAASHNFIVKIQDKTKTPHAPSHLEGITNLRGIVIPVIDLQKRFRMLPQEVTSKSCIVVSNVSGTKVGMIVSEVFEV